MKIYAKLAVLALFSKPSIASANELVYEKSFIENTSTNTKTYIVVFKEKQADLFAACADLVEETEGADVGNIYSIVLNGCSITIPVTEVEVMISGLRGNPVISFIEEDQEVFAWKPASDNVFGKDLSYEGMVTPNEVPSWGLDRIDQCDLPLNNSVTKQDANGVKVYIIDSGIHGSHEDFAGMINATSDCHFDIYPEEGGALKDGSGHGTHVASTTCGHTYGVSENCDLCAVKVLPGSGSGSWAGVIAGLEHVVGNCGGARCVVNMSIGGGKSAAANAAVVKAFDKGITVVVAAGNDYADACNYSPSSEPKAITVGSTTDIDARSDFSNKGSCVDVYAPGSSITAAWKGSNTATKTISGTSMASPHVAGIAASILGQDSAGTPTEVAAVIAATMMKFPDGDDLNGYGLATTLNCGTHVPSVLPSASPSTSPFAATVAPTPPPTPWLPPQVAPTPPPTPVATTPSLPTSPPTPTPTDSTHYCALGKFEKKWKCKNRSEGRCRWSNKKESCVPKLCHCPAA